MPAPILTAVFNVTQPLVGIPGLYADGTNAAANTTNLNAMLEALLRSTGPTLGKGGTLEFPSAGASSYAFDGPITIGTDGTNTQPFNIILRGDGAQSRSAPLLVMTDTSKDFFIVSNNPATVSDDQIAGIRFQDLIVSYQVVDGTQDVGRGLVVQGGSNVRVQRVTFDENPGAAIHIDHGLHCSVIDCDIRIEKVKNSIGISLGDSSSPSSAIETYIAGTTIASYRMSNQGTGVVIYGVEHLRMINCRVEQWTNGIIIQPGLGTDPARKLYFGNVSCFTNNAALTITPSGGAVLSPVFAAQIWFAECEFGPGGGSTSYSGGGIIIGPTDLDNIADQIRFIDCYSCLWAGPGIDIQGGTNVEILGGYYSCNGNNGGGSGPEPYSKSGIAVSGNCAGLRISNVACNNSLWNVYGTPGGAVATQQYGIYVGGSSAGGASSVRMQGCDFTGSLNSGLFVDGSTAAPSNVFAKHCDFTGLTTPLKVTTPVSNLQVSDCPGYNDRNAAVATGGFTGTQSAAGAGYYGPSVITWSAPAPVTVTLNGVTYAIPSGSIYLSLTDQIKFSATPTTISWIGK